MEIIKKRRGETQEEYEERKWWYGYLDDNPEIKDGLLRLLRAGKLETALSDLEVKFNLV